MRRLLPIAAAAAGALLAAQPAIAESQTVHYQDLDLSTPAGQKKLESRIDKAAKDICGLNDVATGTRIRDRDAEECVARAKQQIEQQLAAVIERHNAGGTSARAPAGASSVP